MNDEWFRLIKRVKNSASWQAERQGIESMLGQGVDVNCRNKQGLSALDILMRKETPSLELLRVLLGAGIELQSHRDVFRFTQELGLYRF
jgi:ankyrin repeat protein